MIESRRGSLARGGAVLLCLVVALVGGMATAAFARTGNGPIWVGTSHGHLDGDIYWYPQGTYNGAMRVSGYLHDTDCDSHSNRVDAKVHGYSYTTLWENNACNTSEYGSHRVWDPAMTITSDGYVRVCRFNSWGSGPCADEYMQR